MTEILKVSKLGEQSFERQLAEVGLVRLWATFAPNVETAYTVEDKDGACAYEGENIHKAVAKFNEIAGPFEEHL